MWNVHRVKDAIMTIGHSSIRIHASGKMILSPNNRVFKTTLPDCGKYTSLSLV